MEKRRLGQSQLYVSVIGLGAWGIGGPPFWAFRDEKTSISTIQKALDLGVNLIDTAPVYGFGLSESVVGKAVAGRRDQLIIATKCGLRWKGDSLKDIYRDLSPASLYQEVEDSLRRLGTDRIDLYQVHWPDPNIPVEHVMVALALLKGQGKILNIGVSNFDAQMLRSASAVVPVVSLQPKYNLLERDAEADLLPLCRENNIGVLAYSPLASGMLTGKYSSSASLADWRGKGNMGVFRPETFPQVMAKVEKLKSFANERGIPLSRMALRWVIGQPGISCALAGANTAAQVEDNVAAADLELSAEDMERLETLAQ